MKQQDGNLAHLEGRMSNLETKLDSFGGQLGDIRTAIVGLQATKPQTMTSVISLVKDFGILISMTVAGVLYIAGGQADKKFAVIEERQVQMAKAVEKLGEWRPSVHVERR